MKVVLSGALLLIGVMVGLRLLVLFLEPRMTFYPVVGQEHTPADWAVPYQDLIAATSDGERVVVWHLPLPAARAQILFFHGNAGNLSLRVETLLEFQRRGYQLTAFDYRGYGLSTGTPSEKGLHEDVAAVLELFWSQLYYSEIPTIYLGRSLGGVMAAWATQKRPPRGLILESTFGSKRELLRYYPVLRVLSWFSSYRLATVEYLKSFEGPTLVLHGDRDEIVPWQIGKALLEDLSGSKEFYLIAGGGHNNLSQVAGRRYWDTLETFVAGVEQ